MEYNYTINTMEQQMNEVAMGILAVYGIVMLLIGLFYLISYIFKGIGMYTIAKREGMEYSWLAFIPFARVYLQGELSGTVKLKNKSISNPGIWMIALPIISGVVFSVLYMVFMGISIGTAISMEAFSSGNAGFGAGRLMLVIVLFSFSFLITLIYQAVLKTLRVLVNHQIYEKFTSSNMSIVHGVLGIFIPLYESICFFVMRNKPYSPGMEPKFPVPFQQPDQE